MDTVPESVCALRMFLAFGAGAGVGYLALRFWRAPAEDRDDGAPPW